MSKYATEAVSANECGAAVVTIDRIEAFALSASPSVGPISSLGAMPVRNGVVLAITSKDGVTGWGEIWCNFPPRGNLTRLNLLQDVIAPYILGKTYSNFAHCRQQIEDLAVRMEIHTGEYGPFTHCFAGIDTALADLAARSVNLSLANFLSSKPLNHVPVYASTPNVDSLEESLSSIMDSGHQGIKLKVGLGHKTDTQLLEHVHTITEGRLSLMVDANQNWNVEDAINTLTSLSDYSIDFVEEPLRADAPMSHWTSLSEATTVPIAGGENITSLPSFIDYMDNGKLKVVQPDVAKWGGVSGAIDVGKQSESRDVMCAMHYMGSGLGLAASIHTLAAIGGIGPVELDSNPNPLRTDLGEINLNITNGTLSVPSGPGHGFIPDANALKQLTVESFDAW